MRKLEVGCGQSPHPGYEHLDINPKLPCIEYVAPMNSIPVDDNTFEEVLAIHVIEHQSWREVFPTLKEWMRVLKPGGKIHIDTPNLRWIAQSYIDALNGNPKEFKNDYNIMQPGEIAHLKDRNGNILPSLWANFKIMSSTCNEWDIHNACLDASMLSDLCYKAGASKVDILQDGPTLSVEAYK